MPTKPSTFQDLFRAAEVEILQRNGRLRKAIIERDGSDVNLIVAGTAGAGDEIMGQNILAMSTLFLDSATGEDLDRWNYDRYGLLRSPASPATGFVEFTTTAANPTSFTIPVGTLLSTSDGLQFTVSAAATFAAGSTGPISVLVQSTLAGLSQQAQIGTITSVVTTITGAPTDLAVTNATATAGASDAENDTDFRNRGRAFYTSVSKGTKRAIEAAAMGVPGVVTAVAFEGVEFDGAPGRYVELLITDAYTDILLSVDPTPPNYQTQAQALAVLVDAALDDVRAYGINVNTYLASVVMQPIILQLTFLANVDTFTVSTSARGAILSYVNSLAGAATLQVSELLNTLRQVAGLFVTGSEIVSPLGNVVPEHLQVIRTSLALISLGS